MKVKNIEIVDQKIKIFFKEADFSFAWLENVNKHLPDIFEATVDFENGQILVDLTKVLDCNNLNLKLMISTDEESVDYEVDWAHKFACFSQSNFKCNVKNENGILLFCFISKKALNAPEPQNLFVIGSCFSRSVFRSEPYFNLGYKKDFNIDYTVFHNSLISIMSDPILDTDYLNVKDLSSKDVFAHVDIEFKKNIFQLLSEFKPNCILIDNYIDATTPIVEISNSQYITYNKYFSESIYKRKFANCKIIFPGTEEHIILYQTALRKLKRYLADSPQKYTLILVGARLSKFYFDEDIKKTLIWVDKLEWITESNCNWNRVDSIFLEEFPCAKYIDATQEKWISDVNAPIVGGASPSHMQSGFYKYVFNKIKQILNVDSGDL